MYTINIVYYAVTVQAIVAAAVHVSCLSWLNVLTIVLAMGSCVWTTDRH